MRRPGLTAAAALCALALLTAGCGGDDDTATTSTASSTTASTASTTSTAAGEAAVDCDAYLTVNGLLASVEEIATGSNDGQVQADEALAGALDDLAPAAEGDAEVTEALDTLGQVSFVVTETDDGPGQDDLDAALATLDEAFGADCAAETAECPAPEVLEAEGLSCDEEGNLVPSADGSDGEGDPDGGAEEPPECPAPETLEAEGYTCDSEGNLTPTGGTTECPAPETLEANGYGCDSEGNLYPLDEGSEAEPPGEEPAECPPPETLEAEGLVCDSEGNVTPAP
ncbi:MAG TPA: hypothetical protein VEW93_04475 [Acidimicrobiales bacterium]|nr:hypothetical protein [Acidimicrobiales bacterium]